MENIFFVFSGSNKYKIYVAKGKESYHGNEALISYGCCLDLDDVREKITKNN
jgi:hypothetical protein